MQNETSNTDVQELITSKEFKEIAKLNFIGGELISKLILRILRFNKLNEIYKKYNGSGGLHFMNFVAEALEVKFEYDEESLKNIPTSGAFVTVSNHPFGGVDGVGIFKMILPIRPDYKTISNYMMRRLKPLVNNFIAVDPFVANGKASMNLAGLKDAMRHLSDGHPLGLFPAGEVSSYNKDFPGISDKQWDKSIMRIVQKARIPVIPVYFHGSNSKMFHLLGRIHPLLRTAKIPSELLNKKNITIKISIGKPIDLETQQQYKSIDDYITFLRQQTYNLQFESSSKQYFDKSIYNDRIPNGIEPIAEQGNCENLISEIKQLKINCSLVKKGNYELFSTSYESIPHLMHEIGRQREITFRKVGEGSNKCLDLDKYDLTYQHLIIWDHTENKLVGAYRIGNGYKIINEQGLDGLYTNSLFNFHEKIVPKLSESMELGRSFIVEEYQRKALPLYMLWSGIFKFSQQNPWCKYLFGPVSISEKLDKLEKDRIVSYIKHHNQNSELKQLVSPKNEYKIDDSYDFEKDKPGFHDLNLPVLFKKYLKINGTILEFNVDPLFNNSLDGLMFLELANIPKNFTDRICSQEEFNSFDRDEVKNEFQIS